MFCNLFKREIQFYDHHLRTIIMSNIGNKKLAAHDNYQGFKYPAKLSTKEEPMIALLWQTCKIEWSARFHITVLAQTYHTDRRLGREQFC